MGHPEESPGVVTVFSLGGTIAMTRTGDRDEGVTPALTASQLIDAVPGLTTCRVAIEVRDFRQLPGASLSFEDVLRLAAEIELRVGRGARGVVVTQGTDTIEETAYVLDVVYGGGCAHRGDRRDAEPHHGGGRRSCEPPGGHPG